MKNRRVVIVVAIRSLVVAAVALIGAAGAFGQANGLPAEQANDTGMPRVQNARVENRALTAPIAAEVKRWAAETVKPQWIGYSVPEVGGNHDVCCNRSNSWNSGECGMCRLEGGEYGFNIGSRGDGGRDGSGSSTSGGGGTVKLEGPRNLVILLRAEDRRVMRIRVVSEDCTVDAGGLGLAWLSGVKPGESVAMLREFVRGEEFSERGHDGRHASEGALTAIALHADESADRAMESFVRPEAPEELRKQAAFWLGEARGKAGFAALQKMAKSDPSTEVRAHVAFALSVSREAGALDEMIRLAKDDESSHVRGQALFWLAQKAGTKAIGSITGAIDNDPDTEVKKKAVFALSQLPKDEGVPRLIEVAQSNRNREVRKQAMFWLGQSNDPRALAFFEKVLSQ